MAEVRGCPPSRLRSEIDCYATGGKPLVVMQEDCLVLTYFNIMCEHRNTLDPLQKTVQKSLRENQA